MNFSLNASSNELDFGAAICRAEEMLVFWAVSIDEGELWWYWPAVNRKFESRGTCSRQNNSRWQMSSSVACTFASTETGSEFYCV